MGKTRNRIQTLGGDWERPPVGGVISLGDGAVLELDHGDQHDCIHLCKLTEVRTDKGILYQM